MTPSEFIKKVKLTDQNAEEVFFSRVIAEDIIRNSSSAEFNDLMQQMEELIENKPTIN